MELTVYDFMFLAASVIALAGASLVVTRRTPLYSVLALAVSMLALAFIFFLLHSPFIAVMQVIVYAGAVLVLFLFVIMLFNLDKTESEDDTGGGHKLFCGLVSFLFFVLMTAAILFTTKSFEFREISSTTKEGVFGSTEKIAWTIFSSQILPFEVVSIILVVAMVGAVILTKKKIEKE